MNNRCNNLSTRWVPNRYGYGLKFVPINYTGMGMVLLYPAPCPHPTHWHPYLNPMQKNLEVKIQRIIN
jgi:hypothetical protein